MIIGALSLFNKTNSRTRFNIASWHSRHSLTWRWILSIGRQPLWSVKPYVAGRKLRHGHGGFAVGLGQLVAFSAHRHNGGWQLSASLFWHSIDLAQQESMFYRDLYMRDRDRELEASFAAQNAQPFTVPDHPTLQ